jgi:hypothetical protein
MITRSNLLAIAAIGAVLVAPSFIGQATSFVSVAEARVGRPATPMSYAGVARRTTRRAVAVGATAGAVYAPGCVEAVDAYGRIYCR